MYKPAPVMWPGVKNDDTALWARWFYFYGPILISVVVTLFSLWLDLHFGQSRHWTCRSGGIMALCGGISAYGGASRMYDTRGESKMLSGIRTEVPYSKVGMILGIAGTLIWAYLDRLI